MRRLAGGVFVVLGAVVLLNGGWAAAGPTGPVSQYVTVDGDDEALLIFSARGRNTSCSVSRNVLNRTGADVAVRVLDAGGVELARRSVAAGRQVTITIDHTVVTVPLVFQAGDGPPVELAHVGPYAPCDTPSSTPPTSTPPTTTPSTAPPTTGPPTSPPTTGPTTEPTPVPTTTAPAPPGGPTVTTLADPEPTPPLVPVPTAPPTSGPAVAAASGPSSPPPVSVLGRQVGDPSLQRLPTTGGDTRSTALFGLCSIAVGAAFLLTSRRAQAGRER